VEPAKESTRQIILKSGVREFLEKGLFAASMEDVAIRSCLTRRTLYRYFASKEELAFEAACEILSDWNRYQATVFGTLRGNGLKRFKDYLTRLAKYLSANDNIMKFMGEFDFYFKDDSPFSPDDELRLRYLELSHGSDAMLGGIIAAGIADGSVRPDIDVTLALYSISNILWGFGQRIAARRGQLRQEYAMDPMGLVYYQIELYAMALENPSPPRGASSLRADKAKVPKAGIHNGKAPRHKEPE